MNISFVKNYHHLAFITIVAMIYGTVSAQSGLPVIHVKQYVDTVGFASHSWQMDSVMSRISRLNRHGENLPADLRKKGSHIFQKAAICPHDDYLYAGWLYPEVLKNIHANTIILFGVAHQAKKFNIDNRLVFDTFNEWKEPYGNIRIPGLREDIIKNLPSEAYIIHDSLQQSEHSVEAIIPYLQFFNRKIRIISILVPYMPYDRMDDFSGLLATAIDEALKDDGLKWGKDVAIVISTDAVHYGDEEWNGSNFAYYGWMRKVIKKQKTMRSKLLTNVFPGLWKRKK